MCVLYFNLKGSKSIYNENGEFSNWISTCVGGIRFEHLFNYSIHCLVAEQRGVLENIPPQMTSDVAVRGVVTFGRGTLHLCEWVDIFVNVCTYTNEVRQMVRILRWRCWCVQTHERTLKEVNTTQRKADQAHGMQRIATTTLQQIVGIWIPKQYTARTAFKF